MSAEDPMHAPTASAETRFTYEDLLRLPDDDLRHEIIDGVHYVTASPNLWHQELVGRLFLAIRSHLAEHPHVGRVFLAPADVVLSTFDVVVPDLLFVAKAQEHMLTKANVQGAPALVVEVLSPSTCKRDLRLKRQLFERVGVREYRIVDPDLDAVQVFRPTPDGALALVADLAADDDATLDTPLLPGFALSVQALFAEPE
jgi:Uma2 family endonuclease